MEDILTFLGGIVVDLQGFDESNFGIFNDDERNELIKMWHIDAKKNPNVFIKFLSPDQRKQVTIWSMKRTSITIPEIVENMEKLILDLKTISQVYPQTVTTKKNHSRMRSTAKGIRNILTVTKDVRV